MIVLFALVVSLLMLAWEVGVLFWVLGGVVSVGALMGLMERWNRG